MSVGVEKVMRTSWSAALVMAAVALVLILSQGTSLAAAKKAMVDINTATLAELEAVKGVGPATAKKIIANRPYKSLDELSKAGLSAKKIESFKSALTVGGAPATAAPAAVKEEKKPAKEVKKKGEAAKPKAKEPKAAETGPGMPVDLNTADQKTLEALPGVGPATAKKIIAARPFKSVDDLSQVKGLSKAKIVALKDKVTVGPAAAPLAKPAPVAPAPAPSAAPPAEKPAAAKEPAAPAKPEAAAKEKGAPKLAPGQKVNINTASKEDLDKLFDIGPVRAQAIIDGRPYNKIEDVMKVKGIKQHTFDRIKDYITVK